MTERGLPSVDGAPACPFVAFEDDRESRSTSPDHRHRCYAEPLPVATCRRAPGGVLPVERVPGLPDVPGLGAARGRPCARRGRATRGRPRRPSRRSDATRRRPTRRDVGRGDDDGGRRRAATPPGRPRHVLPPSRSRRSGATRRATGPPRRRGRRVARRAAIRPAIAGRRGGAEGAGTPEFLAGRDRTRAGVWPAAPPIAWRGAARRRRRTRRPRRRPRSGTGRAAPPDDELAGLVGGRGPATARPHDYLPPARPGNRPPSVSSTRSARPGRERSATRSSDRPGSAPRRYEAYPTIRTRAGLPQSAAGGGAGRRAGDRRGRACSSCRPCSASVAAATTATRTAEPEREPGRRLGERRSRRRRRRRRRRSTSSRPATRCRRSPSRFGLTLEELCDANKDTITDCDKIAIGDEIIIPAKAPDEFNDAVRGAVGRRSDRSARPAPAPASAARC